MNGDGAMFLREKSLSEADKLNGFDYVATLTFSHTGAQRQYGFNGWEPWQDSRLELDILVHKKDGVWKTQISDDIFRGATYTEITVDKILSKIKLADLSLELLDVEVGRRGDMLMAVYQRRAEIMPDLISTIQSKAEVNKELILALSEAIPREAKARTNLKSFDDASAFSEFLRKQNDLVVILSRLLASIDYSPEVSGNQNFKKLRIELEGTENRIMVERFRYNEAAGEFNKKRTTSENGSRFKDKFIIRVC